MSNKLDNSVNNSSIVNQYLIENLTLQNQSNSQFINFDHSFENDKKSDKMGSGINKMPKVCEEDFYSGLMNSNIPSNLNHNVKKVPSFNNMQPNMNTLPNPNYMYQPQINQYMNQNMNMNSMPINPNLIKGFNVNMNNPNKGS